MDTSSDFRRGFLYGLADNGITPSQLGSFLLKAAQEKQAGFGNLLDGGTAAAIAAPLIIGGGLGYGAAEITKPQYNSSVDEIHKGELIRQMRAQTRRINRRIGPVTQPGAPDLATPAIGLTT